QECGDVKAEPTCGSGAYLPTSTTDLPITGRREGPDILEEPQRPTVYRVRDNLAPSGEGEPRIMRHTGLGPCRIGVEDRVVGVDALRFRPFLPAVARGATVLEDRPSATERGSIGGRWHEWCPHRLHPQRHGVERIARPLGNAVRVNFGVRRIPRKPNTPLYT